MTREEYIAGLRALATWLEEHPAAPINWWERPGVTTHVIGVGDDVGRASVAAAAEALGVEVIADEDSDRVVVPIGPHAEFAVLYLHQERRDAHDALTYEGSVTP